MIPCCKGISSGKTWCELLQEKYCCREHFAELFCRLPTCRVLASRTQDYFSLPGGKKRLKGGQWRPILKSKIVFPRLISIQPFILTYQMSICGGGSQDSLMFVLVYHISHLPQRAKAKEGIGSEQDVVGFQFQRSLVASSIRNWTDGRARETRDHAGTFARM